MDRVFSAPFFAENVAPFLPLIDLFRATNVCRACRDALTKETFPEGVMDGAATWASWAVQRAKRHRELEDTASAPPNKRRRTARKKGANEPNTDDCLTADTAKTITKEMTRARGAIEREEHAERAAALDSDKIHGAVRRMINRDLPDPLFAMIEHATLAALPPENGDEATRAWLAGLKASGGAGAHQRLLANVATRCRALMCVACRQLCDSTAHRYTFGEFYWGPRQPYCIPCGSKWCDVEFESTVCRQFGLQPRHLEKLPCQSFRIENRRYSAWCRAYKVMTVAERALCVFRSPENMEIALKYRNHNIDAVPERDRERLKIARRNARDF